MSEIEKINALELRVKQLEAAVIALATGQSIGLTESGLVVAERSGYYAVSPPSEKL
jgi:hypothetical protein